MRDLLIIVQMSVAILFTTSVSHADSRSYRILSYPSVIGKIQSLNELNKSEPDCLLVTPLMALEGGPGLYIFLVKGYYASGIKSEKICSFEVGSLGEERDASIQNDLGCVDRAVERNKDGISNSCL